MAFTTAQSPRNVVVIIGVEGISLSIARRLGSGRQIILADDSDAALEKALTSLHTDGHLATRKNIDISDKTSVTALAREASKGGHIDAVIHNAGVSPVSSTVNQVWSKDLIGTANIIDAFLGVASVGMSLICISSMAGHSLVNSMTPDLSRHLAQSRTEELKLHPELEAIEHPGLAYATTKRGTHLRVQAFARAYGLKGARINSISPGIISTSMAQAEADGASGDMMKAAVAASATQRPGTPEDIAAAVAFLCSPEASFITGTDLLIDGGATSSGLWNAAKEE